MPQTVEDIKVGRAAARKVAQKHGVSGFVSDAQIDETVNEVLEAVDAARAARAAQKQAGA